MIHDLENEVFRINGTAWDHCRCLILMGIAHSFVGCGSPHPPTYRVNGTVEFADGAPLTTGGVVLCETMSAERHNARGAIRADGTFELTTFTDGDGAVLGRHRVLVRAKRKTIDYTVEGVVPKPVIDPRFERYETSGLELNVGEVNKDVKLVVERPAASAGR